MFYRDAFTPLMIIYDGVFFQKYLTVVIYFREKTLDVSQDRK